MGLNISGLIIEDNFDTDLQKLAENIEIGFEFVEECKIYDAFERITDKSKTFVIFTNTATIIMDGGEHYDNQRYSQSANSLTFQYYETAMFFGIRYVIDCELLRAFESLENKEIYSLGRKIKAEKNTNQSGEVVINLIEQLSGIHIFSLPDKIKAIKCNLVKYSGKKTRMTEEEIQAMIFNRRVIRNFNPDYDRLFD